jgi:hypothetical protein
MTPPCRIQYKPFTIEAIVGSKHVAALIDTGSTTSVISADFEKQIPPKEKKEKEVEKLNLITACGDPMAKLKTVELQVKIHSVDDNLVTHNFHVVPNLAVKCILGMDFTTNLEFRLNTASRRISYKKKRKAVSPNRPNIKSTSMSSLCYSKSEAGRRNQYINWKDRNPCRGS